MRFVLVPMHSVFHAHLNYVLWYFGLIPMLLALTANGVALLIPRAEAASG